MHSGVAFIVMQDTSVARCLLRKCEERQRAFPRVVKRSSSDHTERMSLSELRTRSDSIYMMRRQDVSQKNIMLLLAMRLQQTFIDSTSIELNLITIPTIQKSKRSLKKSPLLKPLRRRCFKHPPAAIHSSML